MKAPCEDEGSDGSNGSIIKKCQLPASHWKPGDQHGTDSSSGPSWRTTTNILILNCKITFYFLNYWALLYFVTAFLVNWFMVNVGLRIAWPSFCRQKESTKCRGRDLLWPINLAAAVNFMFPRWHNSKESASQCRGSRFDPWVWKIPWCRKWQPTPVFLPGKFHE